MWLGCWGERDGRKCPCRLLVRTARNPGGSILAHHLDHWGARSALVSSEGGQLEGGAPLFEVWHFPRVSLSLHDIFLSYEDPCHTGFKPTLMTSS